MRLYLTSEAVKRLSSGYRYLRHQDVLNQGVCALLKQDHAYPCASREAGDVGYVLPQTRDYVLGAVLWRWKSMALESLVACIDAAIKRRAAWGMDTQYARLIFGSSDNCAGLVLDRYASVWVAYAYHDFWFEYASEHAQALMERYGMSALMVKHRQHEAKIFGTMPEGLWVYEHGYRFWADIAQGQKTGWYYDQRANRLAVRSWVRGGSWADVCCYYGAFGLTALASGAERVTFVDRSAQALAVVSLGLASSDHAGRYEILCSDAEDFLTSTAERYDGIFCDPPCFLKGKHLDSVAVRAYRRWIRLCIAAVRPGGLLVFSSCTSAVRVAQLKAWISALAGQAGRGCRYVYEGRADQDHPVERHAPETDYLCCVCVQLD